MSGDISGEYVFAVRFRVTASDPSLSLSQETYETTMSKHAAVPGDDGWLFFRDNLWRGEVNDEAHLRKLATAALGVSVESVSFTELRCTDAYFEALKTEIRTDLTPFRADDADEVLNKYLGSSIRVE